jgi:outer membrane protein
MSRFVWALPALLPVSCWGGPASTWRYESILWERHPEIRSREDARARYERSAAQDELTLDACYAMALYRSEALGIDGEQLVRLEAQYGQAMAALLPSLSLRGSHTRRDDPPTGSPVLKEQTEFRFNLRQPLFTGLREFYALGLSSALTEAKEHGLRHARLLLFADVAGAFYTVLAVEREIQTTTGALRLAEERLEELTHRNRLGISRRSEVLAQEAQVALTQAKLAGLRGTLEVGWEAIKFLTGLPSIRRLDDALEFPDPPPVETLVERALAERHDVRELTALVRSAESTVGIARAGHLPSMALEANYYTRRDGASEGIDWDAALTVEVPLFSGGGVDARIREAESEVRAAGLRLARLTRQIRVNINRAYADVVSLKNEFQSLEKALASARENYELVQAEYRGGIVTNIEVLAAFTAMLQAELDRDRARYSLKLAHAHLAVQSGALPEGMR